MNYSEINNDIILENINSDELLLSYLELLDSSFNPNLSTKVNLQAYSKKISDKASVHIMKYKEEFAGLYALYINDSINKEAYLTCIGVLDKFKGLGLSYLLANDMVEKAIDSGMKTIKLEVDSINNRAIRFYEKIGFIKQEDVNNKASFYMVKVITD